MSVVSSFPAPARTHGAADRALRIVAALTTAYLVAGLLPMVRYSAGSSEIVPLSTHVVALGVAMAATTAGTSRRALNRVRDWLPLALGPFLYVELRWLISGVGRPHADTLVQGWERLVFPSDPSATWAPSAPDLLLSEVLHACYASYYLLVYLPPAALYLRGDRDAFARTMLALALAYGACFVTYLFFPVDGPRYLAGPAAAPDGPMRTFVLELLAAASSRGTAFPSSHVAASAAATLAALASHRARGMLVGLATIGLTFGTVYGGFHYAVDALAGLAVGIGAWLAAGAIWRSTAAPGEQSARAAR